MMRFIPPQAESKYVDWFSNWNVSKSLISISWKSSNFHKYFRYRIRDFEELGEDNDEIKVNIKLKKGFRSSLIWWVINHLKRTNLVFETILVLILIDKLFCWNFLKNISNYFLIFDPDFNGSFLWFQVFQRFDFIHWKTR